MVSLVVDVQIPMFVVEVQSDQKRLFESSMNGPTPDVPIQDIFALYRRTKTLLAMLGAFAPEYVWVSFILTKQLNLSQEEDRF